MSVGATPAHAAPQPMLNIVRQLRDAAAKSDAVWVRNKGQAVVRISRVRMDNAGTRAIMLLQHANKDAADPSFSKLLSGEIRTEPKLAGEGVAVSAHLLLDLTPTPGHLGTYHAVLENVPSLTRSYVEDMIDGVLRKCGEYKFVDINGATAVARSRLLFAARMRESLLADVAKGRLSHVVLMKRENLGDMFDADPDVRLKEASVRLEPIQGRSGEGVINFISRVIKKGSARGYTNAKFAYVDEQGKSKSPTFCISQADVFDAFVAKASQFTVESDLAQCEADIRQDVTMKMNSLLKAHLTSLAA